MDTNNYNYGISLCDYILLLLLLDDLLSFLCVLVLYCVEDDVGDSLYVFLADVLDESWFS